MKKRILSALLCLCMVMALMPTVAFAEPTSYNLWVGGVEVTSDNASNITGEGITGTVTYDDSTKTLTLNNVNIDSVYSFYNGVGKDSAGIYVRFDFDGALTIKLVGENTITGKLTGSDISGYGFFATTDLIFDGSGSLNISAADGKTGAGNSWSVAIYANGSVNVGAQCTITATSGEASNISAAIYCSNLTLEGAKVSAGSSAGDAVVKAENTNHFSPIDNKYKYYKYIKIEKGDLAPSTPVTIDLPFSLAVKLTGDEKPAKETFKFEIYDLGVEDAEFEIVKDSITAENIAFDENGVAFIEGIIKIKVTGEDQLCNLTEGFSVRMVKGSTKGWTYASEQWRIEPFFENDALDLKIAVKEIVDGEISEAYANGMSFSVSYEAVTEPETPQTGDSSMMVLWIALFVVSGAGATAIYSRKRKSSAK